ncbi:MAG: DUF255 domain-containing protein [Isosphaeraceae bacterium]
MPTPGRTHSPAACLCAAVILLASLPQATAQAPEPVSKTKAKAQPKRPANRLAKETSPYLLLHAHNPVDWYPWGPEAFAKAKAEKKPIFLSVGYSSCYWCHVMERECFMNEAIAKTLNANFVCVKVDREERPDVDQVYMAALQVFGSGGWPMSMFLTPEGRPFFGGTYFPPADREGMEGFPSLLARVIDAWRDHRDAIERDAERLSNVVRRTLAGASGMKRTPLTRTTVAEGVAALAEQFDPEYGGFGYNPENARRPKFPEPVNLVFLLDQHRRAGNDAAAGVKSKTAPSPLEMVRLTLDRMARGGIRDQLAGGYHRYATSRFWIVPHFEKMLYDNAQLASAHLSAFELTGDARWRREAEDTFSFVARTMTSPEGAFYSALDAETDGEEGACYVWTADQIRAALGDGPDVEAFVRVYGLKRDPNFEKDRYVLLEPRTRAEQAQTLNTTPEKLEAQIAPLRIKLLAAREKRPAPLRDDKVLTSWNGLMIAAYADGYRVLKDDRYRVAAEKAADFLLRTLMTPEGRLLRTYRAGQAKLPAYLEDYAFLAQGLLRLHAATGDAKRLEQARALTDRMIQDFADEQAGGFFYTADDHESLIARTKDAVDNVLPSGNSVAIRNLVALGALTKEARYLDLAGKSLDAFSPYLSQSPGSMPLMLVALDEYLDARPKPGEAQDPLAEDGPLPGGIKDVVKATADSVKARPDALDVTLTLQIKEGWHVYANPPGVEGLLATRVSVEANRGFEVEKVEYPKGVSKILASSGDEKVALYEGKVQVVVRLKPVEGGKSTGVKSVPLTVQYQACNDRACLPPAKLVIDAPIP